MPRVTLEVTDAQALQLERLAADQKKSVEQVVMEQLNRAAGGVRVVAQPSEL